MVSRKSELLNHTLLIMLPHRRFPKETGSFPEGHLDGKHTSVTHTHTCTHKAAKLGVIC